MNKERYEKLMDFNQHAILSPEEMKEGWHFCPEWDCLLTNMNEQTEPCTCEAWTPEEVQARQALLEWRKTIGLETDPMTEGLLVMAWGGAWEARKAQIDKLLAAMQAAADMIRKCDYTPARSELLEALKEFKKCL